MVLGDVAVQQEGETKTVVLSPADAFGEVDDAKVAEIPLNILPPEIEVGSMLSAKGTLVHHAYRLQTRWSPPSTLFI